SSPTPSLSPLSLPDALPIYLFLYRLTFQFRHACQHCSCRVAARMCINRQKLSCIHLHTAASLKRDKLRGVISSVSESVIISLIHLPVMAQSPMPSPSCPAAT